MRNLCLFLLLALPVIAQPASAVSDDVYNRLNRAAVEQHILPRYESFARQAEALDSTARTFCASPRQELLPALQKSYHAIVDSWQSIQHVRFGPVDLFFRSQRIAFWPDPRNTIGKQMAELLSKRVHANLQAQSFSGGSVAIQGLPALERLLFGQAAEKLGHADEEAVFRCRYISAIAANLAEISQDTLTEWTNRFAIQLTSTGGNNTRYRTPKEATLELFKSLYTAVELVTDHKLARPLGASAEVARPRLAEAWRSERSLKNIRLNLEAAQNLYQIAFSSAVSDRALDDSIGKAFSDALKAAGAISQPLERAVQDKSARPTVERLAAASLTLKRLLVQRLPQALDIPVGFNALDGD